MELTESNFDEFITNYDKPILIEFWGSWCPPCQMMAPIIDKIEKEFSEKLFVGKINIDRNPSLSSKFDVKGVPTIVVMDKGKELERKVGAMSENQIKEMIKLIKP